MKYLLALFLVLLPMLSFGASPSRLIFEDNFNEASNTYLENHTPDFTLFSGIYHDGYHFNFISGTLDAVTYNSGSNYYSNYFALGDFTYPVRYDFTWKATALYHRVILDIRRDSTAGVAQNFLSISLYNFSSPGGNISLQKYTNGTPALLASASFPYNSANVYNCIVDDTGTNLKIYINQCSGEDDLGVATTPYIDYDISDYNTLKNHGYSNSSIYTFTYHLKVYDSGTTGSPTDTPTITTTPTFTVTPTPTTTPTFTITPTFTVTPTPIPGYRRLFLVDKDRRDLEQDNKRRPVAVDLERRIMR